MSEQFDKTKANLKNKPLFEPFRIQQKGKPLQKAHLNKNEELLVFEIDNEVRALRVREMAYHHVAQGEINHQPYLISF